MNKMLTYTSIGRGIFLVCTSLMMSQCTMLRAQQGQYVNQENQDLIIDIYETSAQGNRLTNLEASIADDTFIDLYIDPTIRLQTITGFGGAFTESSAHL